MAENKKKNNEIPANSRQNASGDAMTTGKYIQNLLTALDEEKQDTVKVIIKEFIVHELQKFNAIIDKYHVLIQFDDTTMRRMDADNIYKSLKEIPKDTKKDILLVLYSFGGDIASAYLISKLCREFTKEKVVVAVPRFAKSAATLICCGADEIHMGSLSELGPIDPQINGLPALGLKNTIKQIAETSSVYPNSSILFSDYLAKTIKPMDLGYFDRIVESASQYAQRLLTKRCIKMKPDQIQKLADRLVYAYNDHGFVIDKLEALEIFGEKIIRIDTEEYQFSDTVYSLFSLISELCKQKYKFYFVGSYDSPQSVGLLLPRNNSIC